MNKLPDYYKILSLPHDANDRQIKKAYKEKALQYHPDVNRSKQAEEVFQVINVAYRTLIDPGLRRQYDFKMKYGHPCEPVDPRRRHPADAEYYRRHEQYKASPAPRKVSKSIRRLNFFIFYSIVGILTVGIIFGVIDLFVNFRPGGLLFSIMALVVIILGVRIIKKERSDNNGKK
jgi:hypothetical protein